MNDELAHYGVKGMKWGIRRDRRKTGSSKRKKKAKIRNKRAIEKQKRRIQRKGAREMSDAELKKRIERLELEKKYKDLSERDTDPGKTIIKKILSDSGQTVAKNATSGAMAYAMKVALSGEFNRKELAKYLAPNPNEKKK